MNQPKWLDLDSEFDFKGEQFQIRPLHEGSEGSEIETLRLWKNANREHFHFKEIISPEQQKNWFSQFKNDPEKQIYVCSDESDTLIACVGFKAHTRQSIELFNLICGREEYEGQGFMRHFFKAVKTGLQEKGVTEIVLEVLKTNTRAIEWYKRQGFEEYGSEDLFYRLRLKI